MTLMVCLLFQSSYSQSGYDVTYDPGVSSRFLSVVFSDNRIHVAGFYRQTSSDLQYGFITGLDTFGRIEIWTEIRDDSSAITISEESGMLHSHGRVIQPFAYFHRPSIGLVIVDSTGNILSTHEYPMEPGSVTSTRDITEVPDGYLITGWTSKPPLFVLDAFILKTDFHGNQKWLRYVGTSAYEETARSLTKVDPNEFVIAGTRYQWQHEPEFYHGWAYAIDSLGNKKWEWEADEAEIPHRGIMSMQYDSFNQEWAYASFLERQTTYPGEDYDVMVPILVRRDSVMNLIIYQEYGPYAINHYMGVLEKSYDGGWIAAGSYTTTTDEYVSPIRTQSGRVIKISANDSLQWSVIDTAFFHPELGSRSYLSGVTESPSGSVYAVGWANNYDEDGIYRSFGWLLKITADGCVDTLCTTTSLLEQIQDRQTKVKVYPNPASDYIIVDLSEDIHDPAYIEIYDLTGRLFIRELLHTAGHMVSLDNAIYGMCAWRVVDVRGIPIASGKIAIE